MKKAAVVSILVAMLVALIPVPSVAKVDRQPGGIPAFLVGCCWGVREGTQWNEGADMHWREWIRVVPYISIIFGIWDGVECYGGVTAQEWAQKNGANWY